MMTVEEQTHSPSIYQKGHFGICFVLCQLYNTGHIQDKKKNYQERLVPVTSDIRYKNYRPTLIFISVLLAKISGQNSN